MIRTLTASSTLDSLRKEAKRWLKAVRTGDAEAITRLRRIYPCAAEPGLRDIQHALALEYGVANWIALKLELDNHALARRTHAERIADFLEHSILNYGIPPGVAKWDPHYDDDPSRREYAARILSRHPEIVRDSIHVATVCGNVQEVERLLRIDSRAASLKGGLRGWEPLLYLAYARLPVPSAIDNAQAVATLLLKHGANPNVQMTDGENPFTAITGLIGEGERTPTQAPPHPHAEELVRLLIERGADSFDTQALYNTSLWFDSTKWLDLLYGYDERAGKTALWNEPDTLRPAQLDYLLGNAVGRNHLRRVEWLLAHGASPTARNAYTQANLHTEAVLHGYAQMAEMLAAAGAQTEKLEGHAAYVAACMRRDVELARTIARNHPDYISDATALLTAARTGRVDVIELLLDLGTPVDAANATGEHAMHVVAWSDSVPAAQLLIARGAQVDVRDHKYGGTPLGWAAHLGKPRLADYLSTVSRDVFSLARLGKIGRLQSLLAAEPALAKTQRDDITALFCLPEQDEDLAMQIAELLLSHGADPAFRNRDGATAADLAERNGMDAAAQLLSDAVAR